MELAAVTVVNAFQICQTELCAKEAVLVLDIGARVTSMNFLRQGLPAMTRAMDFGGGRLTTAIAQALGLEPAGAEEEKRNLSEFMQPVVQSALMPLARELRATIDFFERQQECHLGQIFAAGGTACSPTILGLLGEAAGIKVTPWNPTANFEADNATGLEAVAPCLAAAVGAAGARLVP
jgi:Tfp pilus assembly PilM family ATPase